MPRKPNRKPNACAECGEAIRANARLCRACWMRGHVKSPVLYVVDPATGCWEWQRCRNPDGYGQVRADGRLIRAHRFVYEQHKGPIPDGLDLDHLCRNPGCVNPQHLEAVTRATNLRRGRKSKLTADQVATIRALKGRMTPTEIAERFGVSRVNVYCILGGKSWRDVAPASDDHG